ncbi:HWE histidine kinase domain-containing protein [Caulobacter sp. NIBR1757]|uniref:HWE histidine kinase domain-containing protein n=1 Tax=Caulobacter sp. NIBR1757 TaxID=3016000 RepID=UPI0022F060E4|nr:HWE histidine kinase domain-containing protein [Caulobacter sp. NIBR1757]
MTEEDRLAVLRGLGALDSDSDPHFDRVVRLAAALFGAPRAAIVLVDRDRLWHKAILGLERREYPRSGSLADVMIRRAQVLISGDVRTDSRFDDIRHTLTQVDVAFYACAPLVTPDGAVVGLLAVGDPQAHPPGEDDLAPALRDLAEMATDHLMADAHRLAVERGRRLDRQRRDLALEAGGLGEFEWDVGADRMVINDQMKALTGLSRDSASGEHGDLSFRYVHPEDREKLRAEVDRSLKSTGRYRSEYRIVRPDNGEVRWMMGAGAVVLDAGGQPRKIIGVVQDITDRKRDEEQRETLMAELDHRVKNVLAAVQSLAAQSARRTSSVDGFIESFSGRLKAMAQAHELLTATRWHGASLGSIVEAELGGLGQGQAIWSGPDLFLTPRAANALSLALHELATNAIKYGALSVEGGRVLLDWRKRPDGGFALDWQETGGPPVVQPTRTGFGAVLLDRVTGRELGGVGKVTYEKSGVKVHLTAARAALADAKASQEPPAPSGVSTGQAAGRGGVEGLRLLIVEDATLLALELEAGLVEAGAVIVGTAGDVDEAMALAEAELDAAVLDVNLGGRLVTPVAERLAARGIPFVFATGYGERGAPGGFDAPIVRKPYNIHQIVRAVAEAVAR